jgi:hypothetical protein
MDQQSSLPYSQDSAFCLLIMQQCTLPVIRKDASDVQREACCGIVQENPCALTAVSYLADVDS